MLSKTSKQYNVDSLPRQEDKKKMVGNIMSFFEKSTKAQSSIEIPPVEVKKLIKEDIIMLKEEPLEVVQEFEKVI